MPNLFNLSIRDGVAAQEALAHHLQASEQRILAQLENTEFSSLFSEEDKKTSGK